MKFLKFEKRKTWYFGKHHNKNIQLSIYGCDSAPHLGITVDGGERDIQFNVAFIISIYLTFENFLPESWYPTYMTKEYGPLPEEREIHLYWYESAIWWSLWMKTMESSSTDPKWRRGSIHFDRLIKGKHVMEKTEVDKRRYLLPFFEGSYEVEVVKYDRFDKYQRWFTRKSVAFEVTVVSAPGIPHEGKGENSWDCGEDFTASIWFPGHPVRTDIRTCYDAALYFWHSCMKTREKYGSGTWTPKKFRGQKIQMAVANGEN